MAATALLRIRCAWRTTPTLLLAGLVAACGGGGGEALSPPTDRGVAAGILSRNADGIMASGYSFSIPPGTPVFVDDSPATEAGLKDGMVVRVRATYHADGVSGTAGKVDAQDEIEGPVSSPVPADGMFLVLGHTVFVDDLTVFAGTTGLAGTDPLAANDNVEVHGYRDGAGNVRSTRVERKALGQEAVNVKGAVSNLAATTFNVGPTTVTFDPAIAPAGLADGIRVEVEGVPTGPASMTATAIEREDLENLDLEPLEGEQFALGGFTSGAAAASVVVDGREVQVEPDARFENGGREDLTDGIRLHVTGIREGNDLRASQVHFDRSRIRMRATANAVDPIAQTVVLFTNTVRVNILTELGIPLASVTPGSTRLEFLGYQDAQGRLVAERLNPTGPGDDVLQGRAETQAASNLVILNLLVQTVPSGGAATKFFDLEGDQITPAAFFAGVVPASTAPPGTLLRIKGTFSGGILPFVAKEIELDD